jgi:Uma2 family endonuclease
MARQQFFAEHANMPRLILNVASLGLSPEQFLRLCGENRDLRLELTAQKELIIMTPTNSKTGMRNAQITHQLVSWAQQDGTGVVFNSHAGFRLANGAERSPDASWILKSRWDALTDEEQNELAPICPDFVLELWSKSDILKEVKAKMLEYIANGARLGFLIYPPKRQVWIYRPDREPDQLDNPSSVSGDPVLPRFVLDLTEIWK